MNNKKVWEKEYDKKNLMRGLKPQKSFLNFLKFYKKQIKSELGEFSFNGLNVLDLGSGEGKNSIHLAELGANVWGIEIAENAVKTSNKKVYKLIQDKVKFMIGSIGEKLEFPDNFFDIAIDVTSSNSLSESERSVMASELSRTLKDGGYFFTRGLLKDGDKNAKKLLKDFPGKEKDTYVIPGFELEERVFTRDDFMKLFSDSFEVLKFDKETHYTTYGETKYKRNFYVSYLKNKKI